MSDKNLKSITFPGLSDRYVVPQVDNTLTQAGRPADAKKTGDDLNDLKQDLSFATGFTETDYTVNIPETGNRALLTKRVFSSIVIPENALIENVQIPISGIGANSYINVEVWELGSDNNTLTRVKVVNPTLVANSTVTASVNQRSDKKRYVGIITNNVQAYSRSSVSGSTMIIDPSGTVDTTSLSLSDLWTYTNYAVEFGFTYVVPSTIFSESYKLPIKWRHGVINSVGEIYYNQYPCITDLLIPTEICDYVQRNENYDTYIFYYNYVNGKPVFNSRIQITSGSPIHTINKSFKYFSLHIFKSWSDVVSIDDCNNILSVYSQFPYSELYISLLKYGGCIANGIGNNDITISICHQGYLETDTLGHSLPGGYLMAGNRGFTHGECDVKLTSDNKIVCCHDASFVDGTSGNTIVIADHTLSELKLCDYYGGEIATLEEIIIECKKANIGLFIDQMNDIVEYVLPVITKLNAWSMCYFMMDSTASMQAVLSEYPRAKIVYGTFLSNYDTEIVDYMATLNIDTYLAIGQYTDQTISNYEEIASELPTNVKMIIWTVDAVSSVERFLPFVSGWISNKMSGRDVFDQTYGCGIMF